MLYLDSIGGGNVQWQKESSNVIERLGHDARYAIDSTKIQKELGWEPSFQFEEGIEKTVCWYLDNEEWLEIVTSGDYQAYYEKMCLSVRMIFKT